MQNVWTQVGGFFEGVKNLGTAGLAAAKGAVHGVVGGALSLAQGGNFKQGFIANAIGGATGVLAGGIAGNNIGLHTAIVATAGCAAASATGGKCANGATTAAFANLYNYWFIAQGAYLAGRCAINAACRVAAATGVSSVARQGASLVSRLRGLFGGSNKIRNANGATFKRVDFAPSKPHGGLSPHTHANFRNQLPNGTIRSGVSGRGGPVTRRDIIDASRSGRRRIGGF